MRARLTCVAAIALLTVVALTACTNDPSSPTVADGAVFVSGYPAVVDPLIQSSLFAFKPNGSIDVRKVLRGVARNPASIKGLVSTGIDFNRALRSLRGCRGLMLDVGGLVTANL